MTTIVESPPVNNYYRNLKSRASAFDGLSVAEVFVKADLDFHVEKVPLFTSFGDPVPAWATRRTDTEQILGVVGRTYHVQQNAEIQPLVQSFLDHGMKITRGGTFKQGAKVFLEAELGRPEPVAPGDTVGCRVRFDSSHDGSSKHRFTVTPLRLSCLNGLVVAGGAMIGAALRHTCGARDAERAFEEFLAQVRGQFDKALTQYRHLARKPINSQELTTYLRDVFTIDPDVDPTTRQAQLLDQIVSNFDRDRQAFVEMMDRYEEPVAVNPGANVLDDILRNFETDPGSEVSRTRGTYWDAYNGFTYWLSNQRGGDDARRLESLWYGSSHQLNERALELALAATE